MLDFEIIQDLSDDDDEKTIKCARGYCDSWWGTMCKSGYEET